MNTYEYTTMNQCISVLFTVYVDCARLGMYILREKNPT